MSCLAHSSRWFARLLALALVCVLFHVGHSIHAQTTPSFTLEVLPDNLELESCDFKTPLFIVARNTGAQPIASLTLDPTTDPKITLTPIDPVPTGPLNKGDQRRWSYHVTCSAAFIPTTLVFTATGKSSNDSSGLSQIILKSIPVKLRPPDALDSIATVDIKSNLETLDQASLGDLLVAVTNKSTQPITVTIQPQHSSSITFSLPKEVKDAIERDAKPNTLPANQAAGTSDELRQVQTINGGETYTFPYIVQASQRVAPGKQLLGVNVSIQNDKLHTFLVTKEMTVGVLGESEALKLLGVPSLLFLPGFLVMTAFFMLWRANFLRPVGNAPTLTLTEKDPGYWVISIVISALILGVFVLFRHDFLSLYGLLDIGEVWVVSIVLGAGTYIVMRLVINHREKQNFPQTTDTPQEILHKMIHWRLSMDRPLVTLKNSSTPAMLLLQQSDGSIYVCPKMVLTFDENIDATVHDKLDPQLQRDGSPFEVINLLTDLDRQRESDPKKPGVKTFKWDDTDITCTKPIKLDRDNYALTNNRDILLVAQDS